MIGQVINKNALFKVFFMLLIGMIIYGCESKPSRVAEKEAVVKKTLDEKELKDMVFVAAGEFLMGSGEVDKETLQQRFGLSKTPFLNEHPQHTVMLGDYYIDKYEVTNKKYKEFLDATGRTPPQEWAERISLQGSDELPVVFVSWHDADAYCRWAGKRLPKEAEWEKAARGTEGRKFPWGDEFDIKKTNSSGKYGGVTSVGHFEEDVSPYGAFDMAGNVSEWTANWYEAYPGNDFKDKDYGKKYKVSRGGGWGGIGHYSFEYFYRTSFRGNMEPSWSFNDIGVRCAWSKE